MATVTVGTAATTTLVGVVFAPSGGNLPAIGALLTGAAGVIPLIADVATINNSILDDLDLTHPNTGTGGGITQAGMFYVPNRGILRCLPGDYIAVDSTGWPVLLSSRAAASASWVHT